MGHNTCPPEAHDRSLPDGGGRPYDQPYGEHGYLSDKQAIAGAGTRQSRSYGLKQL